MKNIVILGSTGSIGVSTLDVIARHPSRYSVFALTANSRVAELVAQCKVFQPKFAVIADATQGDALRAALLHAGCEATQALAGVDALCMVAAHAQAHSVMAAIVGAAGLAPTLAAAKAGKTVLLANKEALVMSGALFMDAVAKHGATLLPIDSEHNAVFQSLPADYKKGLAAVGVEKIILTASGGPFRNMTLHDLANVTPDQACAHPNWVMGRKISVDSATMMNKGLEVIEARWLFAADLAQIEVVIHPQSTIHSMVQYRDGSVIAQLGNPDMRTPIAYALGYPERIDAGVPLLDLVKIGRLDFQPMDATRFPCVRLAYEASARGGTAPTILNALNEVAVERFLAGKLAFTQIPLMIESILSTSTISDADTIDTILAADAMARHDAGRYLAQGVL
jgi:1-deoxy-D-xylulose-5-phosphate reductoisomerase